MIYIYTLFTLLAISALLSYKVNAQGCFAIKSTEAVCNVTDRDDLPSKSEFLTLLKFKKNAAFSKSSINTYVNINSIINPDEV